MSRISFPAPATVPVSTAIVPAAAPAAFAVMTFPGTIVACGLSFKAAGGGFSAGDAWTQIYQVAYRQAQAALEPSRFQKALEPCWN